MASRYVSTPTKVAEPRKANVPLLVKRMRAAQTRMERWERKLARAANETVKARAEVRRLWKRLEEAGQYVDPMDPKFLDDAAGDEPEEV